MTYPQWASEQPKPPGVQEAFLGGRIDLLTYLMTIAYKENLELWRALFAEMRLTSQKELDALRNVQAAGS